MADKVDYIDIASQIYTRLEMEYGFAAPKAQEEAELTKFLAQQLSRHTNLQVLAWQNALDLISDEGKEFPPKIPKLLLVMRRVARQVNEEETARYKYLKLVNGK